MSPVPHRLARRLASATLVGLLVAVLAACGGGEKDASDSGSGSGAGEGFPVTIKNTFGKTTVPSVPKRIVTLGWNAQDVVYALGETPVGMPKMTYGATSAGISPWDEPDFDPKKTTLLDTADGPPYEKIASLRPDVILAPYEGFDKAAYDKLSKIAPTVAYPGNAWQTTWQDQTTIIGKALGKSTQAKRLVDGIDTKIAAVAKAHPEFKGKTITVGSFGSQNYIYMPTDPRVQILNQMGFENSPGVEAMQAKNTKKEFSLELSKENVKDVDADVVIAYADDISVDAFFADPVYSSLGAVKHHAAYALSDQKVIGGMSAVSVLSIPWTLDQILPGLSKAAKSAR